MKIKIRMRCLQSRSKLEDRKGTIWKKEKGLRIKTGQVASVSLVSVCTVFTADVAFSFQIKLKCP